MLGRMDVIGNIEEMKSSIRCEEEPPVLIMGSCLAATILLII